MCLAPLFSLVAPLHMYTLRHPVSPCLVHAFSLVTRTSCLWQLFERTQRLQTHQGMSFTYKTRMNLISLDQGRGISPRSDLFILSTIADYMTDVPLTRNSSAMCRTNSRASHIGPLCVISRSRLFQQRWTGTHREKANLIHWTHPGVGRPTAAVEATGQDLPRLQLLLIVPGCVPEPTEVQPLHNLWQLENQQTHVFRQHCSLSEIIFHCSSAPILRFSRTKRLLVPTLAS